MIPTARWFWILLFLVPACSPTAQPSVSVEQATQEHLAHDRLESPALERKLHLANLGVERWHRQGHRGQGIKIAVLDSGFRDYRRFLGKGLPEHVKVRSFRKDQDLEARDSQHGILCGEVLHALAPDAEIMLVNWDPDSPQAFLDAVRWAKSQGARIMSCSLIMPSWSDGEGCGEVHRGLAPLLADALFFASAGNTAQRHWCGPFSPNDTGWHRWRDDVTDNTLTPWGKDRVAVEFYGPTHSSFEVSICNSATGDAIGRSLLQVDATKKAGRAIVRFEPEAETAYQVKVRCIDSPDSTFPSLCRDRPFAGTSAAAPQAAGLAAVLWSSRPNWTPNQVTQALREAALDLGPPGHDCETGYGLIRLPRP
jgi:hypothetical protein